jgi:NAD(P)-dependent dehydrogenase (short-subunit alcohol dehydrogenase family)
MAKWTAADIPSQQGRVAVVTGANSGIGLETASELAAHGAHVVMAARNLDKAKTAAALIGQRHPGASVSLQQLDLSSLDSIHAAAAQLLKDHQQIDLLINNAGVMFPPKSTTKDGFELHFGTNHLGHFALTGLLLDRLLAVAGSRVVTVSSAAHRWGRIHFDDLQWQRSYSRLGAYGQAKLANLLFTYELQRHLTDTETIAAAAHPGLSSTDIDRTTPFLMRTFITPGPFRVMAQTPPMGALPALRAATDPGVSGGQYYGPGGLGEVRGYPKLVTSSARSHDAELAKRLWTASEGLTGVKFPR